jgi:hypothetical protein
MDRAAAFERGTAPIATRVITPASISARVGFIVFRMLKLLCKAPGTGDLNKRTENHIQKR